MLWFCQFHEYLVKCDCKMVLFSILMPMYMSILLDSYTDRIIRMAPWLQAIYQISKWKPKIIWAVFHFDRIIECHVRKVIIALLRLVYRWLCLIHQFSMDFWSYNYWGFFKRGGGGACELFQVPSREIWVNIHYIH